MTSSNGERQEKLCHLHSGKKWEGTDQKKGLCQEDVTAERALPSTTPSASAVIPNIPIQNPVTLVRICYMHLSMMVPWLPFVFRARPSISTTCDGESAQKPQSCLYFCQGSCKFPLARGGNEKDY